MLQTYEMHLTVPPEQEDALRLLRDMPFRVLRFDNVGSGPDVMTSGTLEADSLTQAQAQASRWAETLSHMEDIDVIRMKLEVEPPGGGYRCAGGEYWETHMRVLGGFPARLSRALASTSHLHDYVTVRSDQDWGVHRAVLGFVVRDLVSSGVVVVSYDHELVVWDTNRGHDQRWETQRESTYARD